jgi:hypothetical protein
MDGTLRLVRSRWREDEDYLVAELDGHAICHCYVPCGTSATAFLEEHMVVIRADDGRLLASGPRPT